VTVQLGSTLKTLVARDYPENWPGFLVSVKGLLGSGDIREVGAGCVASLEVVKAFR
jgi:importin-7